MQKAEVRNVCVIKKFFPVYPLMTAINTPRIAQHEDEQESSPKQKLEISKKKPQPLAKIC